MRVMHWISKRTGGRGFSLSHHGMSRVYDDDYYQKAHPHRKKSGAPRENAEASLSRRTVISKFAFFCLFAWKSNWTLHQRSAMF
jgi:hypothetical protein